MHEWPDRLAKQAALDKARLQLQQRWLTYHYDITDMYIMQSA